METIGLILLGIVVIGIVSSNLRKVDIGTSTGLSGQTGPAELDPYLEDLD